MTYRMQPIPDGTTLQDLTTHRLSKSHRLIARLLLTGGKYTCKDIAAHTELSDGATWASVNAMKQAGLIYISSWQRPQNGGTILSAMYSAGNRKDVPRPQATPASRKKYAQQIKKAEEEAKADPTLWQELSKALVPQRNEQKQHEINRLYLNWISEGVYG